MRSLGLRLILERVLHYTSFPHLIWNCLFLSKVPDDHSVSDVWHYDNHYNYWSPKLMIYFNSQNDINSSTQFVDEPLSRLLTQRTDYLGLVWQRTGYRKSVEPYASELRLDPTSLDPVHYTFQPELDGTAVWFYPSRVLHRGVSPVKGKRFVLSLLLTPLPSSSCCSISHCVDKSPNILKEKVMAGMENVDINPYWISRNL